MTFRSQRESNPVVLMCLYGDHSSGPGTALGQVCVCVCVCVTVVYVEMITFKQKGLCPRYLARWLSLTLSIVIFEG